MTLFSIRTAVALCLAASLAACGGGSDKATFVVGGTVVGLAYSGLTLKTGDQVLAVAPVFSGTAPQNVPYAFPKTIDYGTAYTVARVTSPDKQNCEVVPFGTDNANRDSAGHTATINVQVNCVTKSYSLGGSVTGLTGAGLVLINGSVNSVAVAAAATSFTFPELPAYPTYVDQAYVVSVLTQPAGQTCTVRNGAGIMPNAAMTATSANAIAVTCVNN
jgi:hypothetical protein